MARMGLGAAQGWHSAEAMRSMWPLEDPAGDEHDGRYVRGEDVEGRTDSAHLAGLQRVRRAEGKLNIMRPMLGEKRER
jgi:hypothetical protein